MGVGEDEKLENAISVTIIATGFDIDQQNEIVNTQSKKIIHTLEEDQKMEHLLVSHEKEFKYHNLEDDIHNHEEKSQISIQHENDNESILKILITDEIKNIDVDFEEVGCNIQNLDQNKTIEFSEFMENQKINNDFEEFDSSEIIQKASDSIEELEDQELENSFIINDISEDIKSYDIINEETLDVLKENQTELDFGIPLSRVQESKIKNEDSINLVINKINNDSGEDPIVSDPLEPIKIENNIDTNINKLNEIDKISNSELFDIEVNEPELINQNINLDQNPFDKKIIESASIENEKRMIHLKEYNYSFKNNSSKIDELEKEPAYKRHGLDLEHQEHNYNPPKTVIETDENDDIKLKSNNSFLHDNVD
jgi:cell division protein FtsZ